MTYLRHIAAVLTILLAGAFGAHAQEDVWARIKEVNLPGESLEARWHRVYFSPLLQDAVESEGTVTIRQPGRLRWETLKPVQRVTELDSSNPRARFRLPSERDFQVKVLEGEVYTVSLTPIRRDLKQLVGQVILRVNKESFELQDVTILGLDGDRTVLTFSNIVKQ